MSQWTTPLKISPGIDRSLKPEKCPRNCQLIQNAQFYGAKVPVSLPGDFEKDIHPFMCHNYRHGRDKLLPKLTFQMREAMVHDVLSEQSHGAPRTRKSNRRGLAL